MVAICASIVCILTGSTLKFVDPWSQHYHLLTPVVIINNHPSTVDIFMGDIFSCLGCHLGGTIFNNKPNIPYEF
jgi:hypothetical protein